VSVDYQGRCLRADNLRSERVPLNTLRGKNARASHYLGGK
jgi:hypothetical protein